jgi:putative ATP-binding cassette transporter
LEAKGSLGNRAFDFACHVIFAECDGNMSTTRIVFVIATILVIATTAAVVSLLVWRNEQLCATGGRKVPKGSLPAGLAPPTAVMQDEVLPGAGAGDPNSNYKHNWKALASLIRMWLNDPEYKWAARGFVSLTAIHWAARECLWAFVLTKNHAEIMNAITTLHETKDIARIRYAMLYSLAWDLLAALPLFSLVDPWIRTWQELSFRNYATSRILHAYLDDGGQAFYRIKMKESDNGIDNPDQRIGEDIEQISTQVYDLYASILSAVFGCASWSIVIFCVGGRMVFYVAFVMAVVRLIIAYLYFGDSLVNAKKNVLRSAASLRYGLTRTRENAEGVALSGGEAEERRRAEGLFHMNLSAVRTHVWITMVYGGVMGFISNFPSLIIWLCQLPAIMSGSLLIGDGIRVTQGYDQLIKVLDFMVGNFSTIMVLQANGERLNELWDACNNENCRKGKRGPLGQTASKASLLLAQGRLAVASSNAEAALSRLGPAPVREDAATNSSQQLFTDAPRSEIAFELAKPPLAFALEDLMVGAPGSSVRVGGATISCNAGVALLVSGDSGLGKSSVLRALAGLWLDGEGTVRRAEGAEVVVLSQVSYAPQGTLLEAVLYPETEAAVAATSPSIAAALDKLATAAFGQAVLGQLLERWGLRGHVHDWPVILSAGEKQRIGFARLFLRLALRGQLAASARAAAAVPPPAIIAILDESTSGIEVSVEARIYEELRGYILACDQGGDLLTFVSVGHRPTLPRFHDVELRIGGIEPGIPEDEATANAKAVSPVGREVLAKGNWVAPDGSKVPWWHTKIVN